MTDYTSSMDPEMEIPCPYDKAHMVRRKRMQYHLMKCRKNNPGMDFATCPFNACHEMPRLELRYHMASCPDRAIIEKDLVHAQEQANGDWKKGCTDVPSYSCYEATSVENWDEEANPHPRIGVDPSFLSKVQFKNITGMTPAEKRAFHRNPTDERHFMNEQIDPIKESSQPSSVTNGGGVRLPKSTAKAYSMYQEAGTKDAACQQPSTVFQYSLAQAGIGRGRGVVGKRPPAVNGSGVNGQSQLPSPLQAYMLSNKQGKSTLQAPSAREPPRAMGRGKMLQADWPALGNTFSSIAEMRKHEIEDAKNSNQHNASEEAGQLASYLQKMGV